MFKFVPPAQIEIDVCDVITGYCQWSRSYDDTVTDVVDGVILSKFLGLLAPRQSSIGYRVLDYGCGTGRNIAWLKSNGLNVSAVGVDLSKEMLAIANKKSLYDHLVNQEFPVLEERFDLALCILASCHMKNLQELYAFISSHLKPNGYFILIDMHPHMFYVGKGTFVPLDGRKIYIENYVHNISDHIACGINMSLDLKCLQESFVPDTWAAKSIDHGDLSEHPLGIGYLWTSNSPRKGK